METVETRDGKLYKLEKELFKTYSKFYADLIQEENPQQTLKLEYISSSSFDYIFEFLQLHKVKKPLPLKLLKPGVALHQIMEEGDAELIERILSLKQDQVKDIIDVAFYLHVEDLQRRITAGMVAKLNSNLTREGQENENQLRKSIEECVRQVMFSDQDQQKE